MWRPSKQPTPWWASRWQQTMPESGASSSGDHQEPTPMPAVIHTGDSVGKRRRLNQHQDTDLRQTPQMKIQEDIDARTMFDPQQFQPTQWLRKLLTLPAEEKTAFVVAWVIEQVGQRLMIEGASDGQRWQDIGIPSPTQSLGPRSAIQTLQTVSTRGHETRTRPC